MFVAAAAYYTSFASVGVVIYFIRTRQGYRSLPEAINERYGSMATLAFGLAVLFRLYQEVWSNALVVAGFYGDVVHNSVCIALSRNRLSCAALSKYRHKGESFGYLFGTRICSHSQATLIVEDDFPSTWVMPCTGTHAHLHTVSEQVIWLKWLWLAAYKRVVAWGMPVHCHPCDLLLYWRHESLLGHRRRPVCDMHRLPHCPRYRARGERARILWLLESCRYAHTARHVSSRK